MHWGHEALALTTSISATINFLILFVAMRKFSGDFGTAELLHLLGKLLLAGALMAAVCVTADRVFLADPAALPLWQRAGILGLTVGVAAAVYFMAARLLRVAEAREALEMVTRRLGGR
jgi:putative peptidoglycan lipid II flippase